MCTEKINLHGGIEMNKEIKEYIDLENGSSGGMIRIRPYKPSDASTILSWCHDKKSFYRWTAGILGDFPVTENDFRFVESLMPFTAFDETGITGFFTFRNPGESADELRLGFVIVDPEKRKKGYGKAMIRLGIKFAFEMYGAKRISLGVFENNLSAYHCYKSVGFEDVLTDVPESYCVLGEKWDCKEMVIDHENRPHSNVCK